LSEPSSAAIDARIARLRFERSANRYRAAARLESEVGARMFERLDYVRIAPRRILDAGSGPASWTAALGARYPGAQPLALDFSLGMLLAGRPGRLAGLLGRRRHHTVCADFRQLPFPAGSIDLVWCNMALHWVSAPLEAFREFQRVMGTEGLLMFSTLGPDTLKELREAAGAERVHRFIDMHDLGDMLVSAGFSAPVMDMEKLTIGYRDPQNLLSDLRASGQTLARADRPRGLAGKHFNRTLRSALASVPRATYEVLYGHAWKGAPRDDGERAIVHVVPRRQRRNARS
jgi:malonyl-CoA O-methyltransferase